MNMDAAVVSELLGNEPATLMPLLDDEEVAETGAGVVEGLETLQAGRIIEARIPTIHKGVPVLYKRKCLVLGVEGNDKADGITGVYVVRLAFAQYKLNEGYGLIMDRLEQNIGGVIGLWKDMVVRTNRIDLLPAEPFYLGSRVHTVGFIRDRATMLEIGDAVLKGLAGEDAEASRGPRPRREGSELRQGHDHKAKPVFEKFPLARMVRAASLLKRVGEDDYDRSLIQQELVRQAETARIEFELRAKRRAEGTSEQPEARPARPLRLEYITPRDVRKGRRRDMSASRIDAIVSRVNQGVRANREAAGLETPRDPGHIKGNAVDPGPRMTNGSVRKAWAPVEARSYFSVADDYTPVLPPDLKRDDVVILKIADIMDLKDKRPAQRPCVIWNVYEDKDTGEICGLEVFPRTRLRAHEFNADYTASFPNLYNRRIWDGGYLVAQRLARVSVTKEHFHPVTRRIKPLNPRLLDELAEKRAACVENGHTMKDYGHAELPENWRLRETSAPELTPAAEAYAERVMKEREGQQAALQTPPQVGDIVLRRTMRDGQSFLYPSLIWGVWNHKITGAPAAFDCARIDWGGRAKNPWSVELDIDPAQFDVAERTAGESWHVDMTHVDLIPNTSRFFEPAEVAGVIGRLDDETLEFLRNRRTDALIKNKKRGGTYPEFLRFDWTRVEGFSFGFSPENLASAKFAPDLDYFNLQPGYLRHKQGRANNRRGLPPRRKNEGFKPKPRMG